MSETRKQIHLVVSEGVLDGLKHGAAMPVFLEAFCKGLLAGALVAARYGFSAEQLIEAAAAPAGFAFWNTAEILTAAAEKAVFENQATGNDEVSNPADPFEVERRGWEKK